MAKKKIKDFDVTIDTAKVDVEMKKEGENLDVKVDTAKVDVEVHKDEAGTTVTVEAENPIVEKIGNWLGRLFKRNLERKQNGNS
jgi:predicted RNA-binding protein Jag